jgi:hypothetical protein
MRKLVIAEISPGSLKSLYSEVPRELSCLAYANNAHCKNGTYYIVGKKFVRQFVEALTTKLEECRQLFTDAESAKEFDSDEQFLKSLLKIKAS